MTKDRHPVNSSIIRVIIAIMLARSTNSLRVAVLGSGVAGSAAARALAEQGAQVTVFEAGFGIGGRSSTRVTRDGRRYQFDHGAQYISAPKTDTFRDALEKWRREGWVKEWIGTFGTVGPSGLIVESDEGRKKRYVGYPAMNSICRNMLHHRNIKVKLQTRANASRREGGEGGPGPGWELVHGKSGEGLGAYDWLVATDRLSGGRYREDLASGDVDDFRSGVRGIRSVKSLTAMVVFDKPLRLGLDGIQFDGRETGGSLGWAARDASKPGRKRKDGRECWVLQTRPDAAEEILEEVGSRKIETIRGRAREVLVRDFLKSAETLAADNIMGYSPPSVETSIGHRWSAAFPIPSRQYADMDSQLIAERKFVACGDYFGALPGRIEGAYLSGLSAADQLCREENMLQESDDLLDQGLGEFTHN